MNIQEILSSPAAAAEREGPSNKIVWSSRVRLARNLANTPFPGWAKKSVRVETFKHIRDNVLQVGSMKDSFDTGMDKLTTLDKQILVERHFISREHAAKNTGSGLVLSQDENISVMINEEDHLRMQALLPGLQIKNAWDAIDQFDTHLEHGLDFAYSKKRGYLTACPTNLGTGMRASVHVDLPGWTKKGLPALKARCEELHLQPRGTRGESGGQTGITYDISNKHRLGYTEVSSYNYKLTPQSLTNASYRLNSSRR